VKPIQLNFDQNPAGFTASYIKTSGFDPVETLIICPSQRFKGYFAFQLMKEYQAGDLLSPSLLTIAELTGRITASLGKQIANDMERLSMLYRACKETESIGMLFPGGFMSGFSAFKGIAKQIWSAFDELNAEELFAEGAEMPHEEKLEANGVKEYYTGFRKHLKVFMRLYDLYYSTQSDAGSFDRSFLFKKVTKKDIELFFNNYQNAILVSPLALTGFEKRVFDTVKDKLTIIYQDTSSYDFSRLLDYMRKRGGRAAAPASARIKDLDYFEVSSRTAQLMNVLTVIRNEVDSDIEPHEIAVINIDSLFCEMLYDSLCSLGMDVNYSAGIPVKKSPLFGLLSLAARFFKSDYDSALFLELCRNALFREAADASVEMRPELKALKQKIIRERVFRIPPRTLGDMKGGENIQTAFHLLENVIESGTFTELHDNLEALFAVLTGSKTYEFNIVKETLLTAALELQDLEVEDREKPFDIFFDYVRSKKYPVLGKYGSGIQIIGLLESRGIKFRSLILPSFNEGFLPAKTDSDILLSLNLRKDLKLPTFLDREDLELYYLMRVLESAEHACLLSINDKTGEIDIRSRFYYHLADIHRVRPVRTDILTLPVKSFSNGSAAPVSKASSAGPGDRIRSFSRLDVDRIKKCETRYYISRVLKIDEGETLSRKIELNLVGMKVHSIFTDLYRGIDKTDGFPKDDIFEKKLDRLFETYFADGTFFTKEEVLAKRILKSSLFQAMKNDLLRFREGYQVCGEFIEKTFTAEIGTGSERVSIRGRIDRIDRSPAGGYMIVDYKTGRLPENVLHFAGRDYSEVQLGIYGLLFNKTYPEYPIEALCYFDLLDKKDIEIVVSYDEVDQYLKDFEDHLAAFLQSFSRKETLSLAADYEECRYCPYFNICRVLEE
jgi:hypothetical protein